VPKEFLNEKGDVMVDQFLRVKGLKDVWAAGDIVDCQPGQFIYTGLLLLSTFPSSSLYPSPSHQILDRETNSPGRVEKQAAAVAKNLDLTLKSKQPVAYKSDGDRTFHLLPFLPPYNHSHISQQCSQ
jgi:hypothetical protein